MCRSPIFSVHVIIWFYRIFSLSLNKSVNVLKYKDTHTEQTLKKFTLFQTILQEKSHYIDMGPLNEYRKMYCVNQAYYEIL